MNQPLGIAFGEEVYHYSRSTIKEDFIRNFRHIAATAAITFYLMLAVYQLLENYR